MVLRTYEKLQKLRGRILFRDSTVQIRQSNMGDLGATHFVLVAVSNSNDIVVFLIRP